MAFIRELNGIGAPTDKGGKGDAREPGSPKTCRKGRSPGRAEAQAVNSLHRHHSFPRVVQSPNP